MPIGIHDKSPEGRRKLKEGPKAQEAYVETLHDEWIQNHASKEEHDEYPPDLPENVRLKYAENERITRAICEEKGMFDGTPEGPIEIATEHVRDTIEMACLRGQNLVKIAAQESQMYGYTRPGTLAEIEQCRKIVEASGVLDELDD
jgi:hypothetical protein